MSFLLVLLLGGDCHQAQAVVAQQVAVPYAAAVAYAPVYWTYTVGQEEQLKELRAAVSELATISRQNQQLIAGLRSAPAASEPGTGESETSRRSRAIFERACYRCHVGDKAKGDFRLDLPMSQANKLLVEEVVRSGAMPPKPEPSLSDEDFASIQAWAREDSKAVRNVLKQKGKEGGP